MRIGCCNKSSADSISNRQKIWVPLSWFATSALISLGWILFRANSLSQARDMLVAIASLASYSSHSLTSSLYVLIGILAAGYALVLVVHDAMEGVGVQSEAAGEWTGVMALVARSRWYWLPAVYALALITLLMISLTQQGGVGQMMYRSF